MRNNQNHPKTISFSTDWLQKPILVPSTKRGQEIDLAPFLLCFNTFSQGKATWQVLYDILMYYNNNVNLPNLSINNTLFEFGNDGPKTLRSIRAALQSAHLFNGNNGNEPLLEAQSKNATYHHLLEEAHKTIRNRNEDLLDAYRLLEEKDVWLDVSHKYKYANTQAALGIGGNNE